MGTRQNPTFGLGFVDDRLSAVTLVAKGAGVLDSAYTEASPIPGVPVPAVASSRWRPHLRQAQSVAIDVRTLRGGYPGRDRATVAYLLGSESAATDLRSWTEPNLPTGWTAPNDYQVANFVRFEAARIEPTHEVVVIGVTSAAQALTWGYNPRTDAWATRFNWSVSAGGPGLVRPIMMASDPNVAGRLLVWSGSGAAYDATTLAYYSDDKGVSWTLYATGLYSQSTTTGRGSVAVDPVADWVMVHNTTQWASSDRGVTWENVDTLTGTVHSVIRGPAGYVVLYLNGLGEPCVRVLGSARTAFTDATEIVLSATAAVDIVGVVDDDGTIYVYRNASTDTGTVKVSRSTDGGTSWGTYLGSLGLTGTAYKRGQWDVAVASLGSIYTIGGHDGAVTNNIHATRWGGWSNVDQGYYGPTGSGFPIDRLGRFGYYEAGNCYLPYDTPAVQGYATTNTGTISLTPATGVGLSLVTTLGQISNHSFGVFAGSAVGWGVVECALQVNSGSVAATSTIRLGISLQDGVATGVQAIVHFGTNGIELRDNLGGAIVRATQTLTMDGSAGQVYVRLQVRQNGVLAARATAWYRLGPGTTWTRWADEVTLTPAALGTSSYFFGHGTGTAGNSTWRFAAGSFWSDFRHGIDAAAVMDDDPADRVLGLVAGRPVPGAGATYPVPDATADGENVALLSAAGGPTYTREEVDLPVAYTYGSDLIHAVASPSPRNPWRATGTSEVRFVYDQGASNASWWGGAAFLLAVDADFRTATLATDDGAGGITSLGTLDKGWSSINYTKAGRVVQPRTGTATIPRYFAEGELVGGYVVMNTAGLDVARRITRSTAGYWTTDSTTQKVRLEIEGTDGSETAAGSGQIVAPSGLLVVYLASDAPRRYVRISINSGQVVPGGRFAAGVLSAGRLVGVGALPSWDWSSIREFSRTTVRAADGSLTVRRTGPSRRTWTYGWPDGVDLFSMRALASSPGYVAPSGGLPIGTNQDAWSSPLALLEDQMRAGEVPAVVVPQLPAGGTTITDPTLFLYGRLASDSVGLSSIRGTEGTDEWLRVDSLAFEEIV